MFLATLQVPLYDLRSPLGVAPAALTASKQQPLPGGADAHAGPGHHLLLKAVSALTDTQLPPSLIAAKAFGTNRAALRAKVASSGQVCLCMLTPATCLSLHALLAGSQQVMLN
jgi:hypothetical protein